MKLLKIIFTAASFSLLSPSAFALGCGTGVITNALEGGWNKEDFRIKLEYWENDNTRKHIGTESQGYIVFKQSSLTPERLENIRKAAYMALVSGTTVRAYTHFNDCSDADQIELLIEAD